uniref:Dehydrogenase/reductase (SDR family) member 11b n=1 Tax=Sinocyclocheilus grahami TaxID=75366 RepID=A0A672M0U5_SINGR
PEPLLSGKPSGWKTMMDVYLTFYSSLYRVNKTFHIFVCFSMSGYRVVNNANAHFYTASKYAVTALTEGLRQELREAKTHIRATCISPGLVETEFAYRLFSETQKRLLLLIKCLQAADIANAVLYVLSASPHVQVSIIHHWRKQYCVVSFC